VSHNDNQRNQPRTNGRGLETAQRVAAIALAALTFGGIVFSAGSLFQRIGSVERTIAVNSARLNELELWRREAYGAVIDNAAQHKRIEELIRDMREDIAKLELLIRNRP
jgi:hypothetical protein